MADGAAFRESLKPAEPLGQAGEDRVIVAGLTMRLGHGVHGDQQGIVGVAPDILALQGHGARQHEVGMPCRRRPGQLVNDQRVDLPEGPPQASEILMMMERVAAGPIDQADIGISPRLPVVAIGGAGLQQHVRDAGDGDEVGDAVAALRQRGYRHGAVAAAVIADRPQGVAVAAARQADLTQCGGENGAHPDGLFAMLGALERVRHDDQAAPAVETQRKRP